MVSTAHDLDVAGAGRSDLFVGAGKRRLLAVPLPASAVDPIEHGESLDVQVYADVGLTWIACRVTIRTGFVATSIRRRSLWWGPDEAYLVSGLPSDWWSDSSECTKAPGESVSPVRTQSSEFP